MQRVLYRTENFQKDHPGETTYRNSLAEMDSAIRLTLKARAEQKPEKTDPHLVLLQKLDGEGLLEAWIFFAAPDEGIAKDYPAYRAAHQAQLEQYVNEYMVQKSVKAP